jgi:uncharacterized protein YdeI (YjbR/CyaY-like superfamily)
MQIREAVTAAKKYVSEIFAEEQITRLTLEEVEFDEAAGIWNITIGFSWPWDAPQNAFAALGHDLSQWRRRYKVVRISDATGQLLSIKNREPADAGSGVSV